MYLCANASAFCAGPGRESELGVVSQISSVPLMFSIGGVTGVKGDESSPPGDSCKKGLRSSFHFPTNTKVFKYLFTRQ